MSTLLLHMNMYENKIKLCFTYIHAHNKIKKIK